MAVVQNTRGYTVSKNWLEKVDAVCATVDAPKDPERYSTLWQYIRPVYLMTGWQYNSTAGAYMAEARFVSDQGNVPRAGNIKIFQPPYVGSSTALPAMNSRCWAIYRGKRWELLERPVTPMTYTAGAGIAITYNTIENTGVINVIIPTNPYTDSGTLYLNKNQFEWVSSSLDIVGKKEVSIKGKTTEVVKGVEFGTVSKYSTKYLYGMELTQVWVISGFNNGTPQYTLGYVVTDATKVVWDQREFVTDVTAGTVTKGNIKEVP